MSNRVTEPSFWILSALAAGPRHGYGILQDVNSLSAGETSLKVPTLYATLDRLQHDQLIEPAGEEVVDGRARRYFILTDRGAVVLQAEAAKLAERARIATQRLAVRPRPAVASVAFA
ncbi:MAG: PadR family transcriptional regulator [Microbacterium sp.]|uniref:PadR family transcriptional regulator n=1 Tax=Microbacterium sp. TaxID=51671 RepID=UPI003F9B5911